MEIVMLRLGTLDFRLRGGVKLRRLERQLVAAVRRGGGVVKLPVIGDADVDAVVGPATPIAIERRQASDVDAAEAREPRVECDDFNLAS
jgi:hypothetical protein